MREESFGPVIGLMKVKDDNEAVKLMNDTAYGLTASVHGKNFELARDSCQHYKVEPFTSTLVIE